MYAFFGKKRSFDLLKLFTLIITSLSFDNVFQQVAANVCDHTVMEFRGVKKYKNGKLRRMYRSQCHVFF